ncbi:MAG: oxidoreductase [Phenylobacterium zucineum]|nr:MAG: oxidoreductase [Phenylobacterium zucineum]
MPKLIKRVADDFVETDDPFTAVADDQETPDGDVIVSFARFQTDGDNLIGQDRRVGVRLEPADEVEALSYDLAGLSVVALAFPKFRDGRAFTSAHLLVQRLKFSGEVRAVGEVLRDQAGFMVRCGFNAFEPADGATADQWARSVHRHRHVYQRAADTRPPAFIAREGR